MSWPRATTAPCGSRAGRNPRLAVPLALALVVLGPAGASAQTPDVGAAPPAPSAPADVPLPEVEASPWYLERGTDARVPLPGDDLPSVIFELQLHLRDGGVPGFYDGQFASTADRPAELARLARDPDIHHVLRMMAVMALQEASQGDALRDALLPLLLSPRVEFDVEKLTYQELGSPSADVDWVRTQLDADLSRHARFAMAKGGIEEPIRAKIEVMRRFVDRIMHRLLDPAMRSDRWSDVRFGRTVIFDIAYHYQQFDDFDSAAEWFRKLTDSLPGQPDTRWAHYNLACIAALQGRAELAVDHLGQAYEVGFTDIEWMDEDGDLASLRGRADYAALRARILVGD